MGNTTSALSVPVGQFSKKNARPRGSDRVRTSPPRSVQSINQSINQSEKYLTCPE